MLNLTRSFREAEDSAGRSPGDTTHLNDQPEDSDSSSSESELDDEYRSQNHDYYKEVFTDAGARYGRGSTFMEQFDNDRFSEERANNLYYPFANRADWEIGEWLLRSNLSMSAIDEFMSLEIVRFSYVCCCILV